VAKEGKMILKDNYDCVPRVGDFIVPIGGGVDSLLQFGFFRPNTAGVPISGHSVRSEVHGIATSSFIPDEAVCYASTVEWNWEEVRDFILPLKLRVDQVGTETFFIRAFLPNEK
jgi:hypothetical protein